MKCARGGAEGWRLFLDELGGLSLDLQPKLLRALAGGQVKGVGASSFEPMDVRLVAATSLCRPGQPRCAIAPVQAEWHVPTGRAASAAH